VCGRVGRSDVGLQPERGRGRRAGRTEGGFRKVRLEDVCGEASLGLTENGKREREG